jgi:hypothetical protein
MKKNLIFILGGVVILILLILGIFGWQVLVKKGKPGSFCKNKEDCETKFCVKGRCTEGKEGDPCLSHQDCNDLICVNSVCSRFSEKPNQEVFQEYFDTRLNFRLLKVEEWPKEGPPKLQPTENFKLGDQICLEATLKKETKELGSEIYDPYEGKVMGPMGREKLPLVFGTNVFCFGLPLQLSVGKRYEYKVYVGQTLVAILPLKIVEK